MSDNTKKMLKLRLKLRKIKPNRKLYYKNIMPNLRKKELTWRNSIKKNWELSAKAFRKPWPTMLKRIIILWFWLKISRSTVVLILLKKLLKLWNKQVDLSLKIRSLDKASSLFLSSLSEWYNVFIAIIVWIH